MFSRHQQILEALALSSILWHDLACSEFTYARIFQSIPEHSKLPDNRKMNILVNKIVNYYSYYKNYFIIKELNL